MASDKNNKNKYNSVAGSAFVGCIVIGAGIGMLTGQTDVYAVLGLGVGFIVMAFLRFYAK